MIKVVALIEAKKDLTREEFLRFWRTEHPAFVWKMPGIRRYVQSPAVAHRTEWPFDGLAELYFDDKAAVKTAFEGPAADAVREHEEHFIEKLSWFLADEAEIESVGSPHSGISNDRHSI